MAREEKVIEVEVRNAEHLSRLIHQVLRKYKQPGITFVSGDYLGSMFDNDTNELFFDLGVRVKSIGNSNVDFKEEVKVKAKFTRDYSQAQHKHFDAILSNYKYRGEDKNVYITYNHVELYYNLLNNALLAFQDEKYRTVNYLNSVVKQMSEMRGYTYPTKQGVRTQIPYTVNDKKSLIQVDVGDNFKYVLTCYTQGTKHVISVDMGKVRFGRESYTRLPNGYNSTYELMKYRERNDEVLQDGTSYKLGAYERNLNILSNIGKDFLQDKDVYLNSKGTAFRVELGERLGKQTVSFYALEDSREGVLASRYYFDTIFREDKEFKDLQLQGDIPSWFIDSHVLTDIYEDIQNGVIS